MIMSITKLIVPSLIALYRPVSSKATDGCVDLNWYPPNATAVNSLANVINGSDVYGFIFDSSVTPGDYGTYNWCNMPHVRSTEYPKAGTEYSLKYVEVIHRHHKRTPYAANTFPIESYPWYCSDEGLFFYGKPLNLNQKGDSSASTYWSVRTSPSNPFLPEGFNGTCQFPQITRGGLDDSHQHGLDLLGVYGNLVDFLPLNASSDGISFRVTNNVITSQVAGIVVQALVGPAGDYPLLIQPASIDSLEPTYACPTASSLYSSFGPGSKSTVWLTHLQDAASLYERLDSISGVSPTDSGFHMSFDHYFDNLSARLCHAKPLPCRIINGANSTDCITQAEANAVFRLGEYEYDFLYRSAGNWTLQAAVASYGVYIAELASNLRAAAAGTSGTKYRHNVAHDGSISRLLAILQVDVMIWPGMGSELVFELFGKQRSDEKYVRILWGGKILRSSNPTLGLVDMVSVETMLAYFDGLVGVQASKVPNLCDA